MKLLIIGDAFNQFVINFAYELKKYQDSIYIDIVNPFANEINISLKNNPYNKIFAYPRLNPIIAKIPKLRGLINLRNLDKTIKHINENIHEYDVVLMHGMWLMHCYIFSKLKTTNLFSAAAIWGSDFYKRENEAKLFQTIDKCDLVVISTEEMVKDFLEVRNIEGNKIRNCLFGLAPLNYLFDLQNITAKESKKRLGLNEDDFIILCGYNGSPNHQHLEIFSILSDIKSELPEKTKLIVPLTYGGSEEYKMKVKKALEGIGMKYVVYERFLSDENTAHLRKSTDLMIQIPITDAFSGSLQEHLFAQNIVIAGSWLPYQS